MPYLNDLEMNTALIIRCYTNVLFILFYMERIAYLYVSLKIYVLHPTECYWYHITTPSHYITAAESVA